MNAAVYWAKVDDNGILCVDSIENPEDVDMGWIASHYPEVIYFEVGTPPSHVVFYASQDVPEGRGEPLSTWSVYREEYAASDLDSPLDDLTVKVATVIDEATADRLANHLYMMNLPEAIR